MSRAERIAQRVGLSLLLLAVVALWGGCVRWEWRECRQVGHGKLYCALHVGRR